MVDGDQEDRIQANLPINMTASALELHDTKVLTVNDAKAAMEDIREAVQSVSQKRAVVGTVFNRFFICNRIHADNINFVVEILEWIKARIVQ